jgi:7-keto-8-aminopelargonate synthetase-like enzyme
MKKSKYESMIRMINEISNLGKQKGLGRLYIDDSVLNGREISIENKNYIHFGSCGYLGLELDERLKEAAIDAIRKYGTFFVSSRTYVACSMYPQLENNLKKMFNADIVIYPKVSQGHFNVMPIIIGQNEIVIFDQQAHISMQETSSKLKQNGTDIMILRHNNMKDLEEKIIEYRSKYDKIWYAFDGVYSMFGDSPNYPEIDRLLKKYKQLYLYIDDAHGTSWCGEHGVGYALSKIELNERIVLIASMTKAFGATGGVFVFKDKEMYEKIDSWGGAYTYAGPMDTASLGAAIESTKLHLSDEIYQLQNQLKEKIDYCHHLLEKNNLPVISSARSPIFYIGLGTIAMGYNMIPRLMNDGYYTNIGAYPAVPESCTGLRFTLTNHLTLEDIKGLVESIARNLPLALIEENRSMKDIVRAFRKYADLSHLLDDNLHQSIGTQKDELVLETYDSISQINAQEWDNIMSGRGAFTSAALKLMEQTFCDNIEPQSNWKYIYYIIRSKGQIVLASFLTVSLNKDDMLSPEKVSLKVEEERKKDPYYMTSTAILMGSQLTNGDHLYVNYDHPEWKEAVKKLIAELWLKQEDHKANMLFLRDFNPANETLCTTIFDMGFAKVELPDNNIIYSQNMDSKTYFESLNKKQRYNLRRDVYQDIEAFSIENSQCNDEELQYCYQLYLETKSRKYDLNTFDLPYKVFELTNQSPNWEIIRIFHKDFDKPVSMGICYRNGKEYATVIYGMGNKENYPENIYKKTLYLVIKHAIDNACNIIHMGITADVTKHMFGATRIKQLGYGILKDNYNAILLNSMENSE